MKRLGAMFRRPLSAVAIAGLLLTVGVGAGAYALASTGGTISACVNHSNGVLYRAGHCKAHDRKLTWNVQGPRGAQGPPGVQYAWSSFTYPGGAHPQSDGHVATFTFNAPKSGFALVAAQFQIRVHGNGTNDCHLESQLATAPAVIGIVQPGHGSAGFVDEWINSNLPTEIGGSTYLGQNMSVSRVFHVVAGPNKIFLNGQYNNYGAGQANCLDALWGPITMSAVFANSNPTSSITVP